MKPNDLEKLAEQVSPQSARHYALARGWQRVEGANGAIALFRRPESDLDQLIVPLRPTGPDFARRMLDAVAGLSDFEKRSIDEVLTDLFTAGADVVRYRVVSPDAERGDLSLEDGIRILEGAKRSLLASACSVISPSTYYPRMSRSEAVQLLNGCRLLQTERGSFTVALACPLMSVDSMPVLFGNAPFGRRTTEALMDATHNLVASIEADKVDSIYSEEKPPVISANFCDALLRMRPPDERSQLKISVSWASAFASPDRTEVPREVSLQRDYFTVIEDIYQKLRPSREPATSLFVGFVDTLNGSPGAGGQMQGETRFSIFHDEEILKARAELGPSDYQTAVKAHSGADYVKFNGILHRGLRIHRISEVSDFNVLGKL